MRRSYTLPAIAAAIIALAIAPAVPGPIWLPHPQHCPHVLGWTQIRPSHPARVGTLQFEPHGSSRWTNIERLRYTNSYGFLTTYVALPSAGLLRLSWNGAHGRAAQVT